MDSSRIMVIMIVATIMAMMIIRMMMRVIKTMLSNNSNKNNKDNNTNNDNHNNSKKIIITMWTRIGIMEYKQSLMIILAGVLSGNNITTIGTVE